MDPQSVVFLYNVWFLVLDRGGHLDSSLYIMRGTKVSKTDLKFLLGWKRYLGIYLI